MICPAVPFAALRHRALNIALLVIGTAVAAHGQTPGGFYFTQDTLRDSFAINDDNAGYSGEKMTVFYRDMTLADTAQYTWTMTTPQWPSTWEIFFCDPNRCNDPAARTADFVMEDLQGVPVDSAAFRIGVNTGKNAGQAEVRVTVCPKQQPSKTVTFHYFISATIDSSRVVTMLPGRGPRSVMLARLPHAYRFMLCGCAATFAELIDIRGRCIGRFTREGDGAWILPVRHITAGAYLARIVLENGSVTMPVINIR